MYLDFFKIKEFPFSITPDPRFLYFSKNHKAAFDHLLFGITSRKGFITLTGECGCGKSTICRAVLGKLGEGTKTALILNPVLDGLQLLRSVVDDLGIKAPKNDRYSLVQSLNAFLLKEAAAGNNVVLIIDEAQDIPLKTLEEVRLLSNLETTSQKLLQIVLSGQQELNELLARPELRQLRQRITVRFHIRPMDDAGEIASYIKHRLQVVGAPEDVVFTDDAVEKIYRYSKGVPRLVNAICDYSMMAGFVAESYTIDKTCVDRAEYQLEGEIS